MTTPHRDDAFATLSGQIAGPALLGAAAVALAAVWLARRRPRYSFKDRVVVITGGARGFGLAIARRLAKEGAGLVLLARTREELDRAVRELAGFDSKAIGLVCDIRREDQVQDAIARIVRMTGRIDVLINNAGVISSMPFEHAELEDYQDSLDTHFWGPLFLIRECLPIMKRQGGGRILNVSSIGGRIGVPHMSTYAAGKFALVGLSETLQAELTKDGILVTTATPGLMRTGSHRNVLVRGQHQREATWFSLASLTPLTTISADRAARAVIEACRSGRARTTPGWQARAAELVDALTPSIFAGASALAAAGLPGPTNVAGGNTPRRSRSIDLGWDTMLTGRRKAKFNQPASS